MTLMLIGNRLITSFNCKLQRTGINFSVRFLFTSILKTTRRIYEALKFYDDQLDKRRPVFWETSTWAFAWNYKECVLLL